MTLVEFLHALALTESGDNPDAPLGDHGRALGRWQVHPDWVDWASKHYGLWAKVNETWDDRVRGLVSQFFLQHCPFHEPHIIAMAFHLGHFASPDDDGWDEEYARRFREHAAKKV